MKSSTVPLKAHTVIGQVLDNALYLTPVAAVMQMRPSTEFWDAEESDDDGIHCLLQLLLLLVRLSPCSLLVSCLLFVVCIVLQMEQMTKTQVLNGSR